MAVMGVLISGYSLVHGINQRWLAALVCLGQVLLLVMSRSATSAISLLLMLGLTALALGVSIHERPVVRFFSLIVLLVGAICGLLLFGAYDSIHEMTGRAFWLMSLTLQKGWILPFSSQYAHLIKWLKCKRRQPPQHKNQS